MEFKEAGNAAFRQSEWSQAFELYSKALQVDPSMTTALANRAACAIQLNNWQNALEDCDRALRSTELTQQLRIKVLWRKAVCVRNLGTDENSWQEIVRTGLSLDPTNEKLNEEEKYIFITKVDTMPAKYTSNNTALVESRESTQQGSGHSQSQPQEPNGEKQDFLPSLPLTYNGVLRLIRSKSPRTFKFWYQQVSGAGLKSALAQAGVEPDTLDYFFSMIASNPHEVERNKEYIEALKGSPRYEMALFMADASLHAQAMAVIGN